jgi:hypothetical protein
MGDLVEQLELELDEVPKELQEYYEHLKELGLDI